MVDGKKLEMWHEVPMVIQASNEQEERPLKKLHERDAILSRQFIDIVLFQTDVSDRRCACVETARGMLESLPRINHLP